MTATPTYRIAKQSYKLILCLLVKCFFFFFLFVGNERKSYNNYTRRYSHGGLQVRCSFRKPFHGGGATKGPRCTRAHGVKRDRSTIPEMREQTARRKRRREKNDKLYAEAFELRGARDVEDTQLRQRVKRNYGRGLAQAFDATADNAGCR